MFQGSCIIRFILCVESNRISNLKIADLFTPGPPQGGFCVNSTPFNTAYQTQKQIINKGNKLFFFYAIRSFRRRMGVQWVGIVKTSIDNPLITWRKKRPQVL